MMRKVRNTLGSVLLLAMAWMASGAMAQGEELRFYLGGPVNTDLSLDGFAEDPVAAHEVTVVLVFANRGDDGRGRRIDVRTTASFPVRVVAIENWGEGSGPEVDFEVVEEAFGALVDHDGITLVRNIVQQDDLDLDEFWVEVTLAFEALGDGVLAAEGSYSVTFEMLENENPIEFDFSSFFDEIGGSR